MKAHLRMLAMGIAFGVALSLIGFTSWDEVHGMFTFADLRLTLTFASAVALIALAWAVWGRFGEVHVAPRSIHRGTVPGAMLFGAGWAVSGACPSIAFVQLGEGQFGALVTIVGIFLGNVLFATLNARVLHIPVGSCAEP